MTTKPGRVQETSIRHRATDESVLSEAACSGSRSSSPPPRRPREEPNRIWRQSHTKRKSNPLHRRRIKRTNKHRKENQRNPHSIDVGVKLGHRRRHGLGVASECFRAPVDAVQHHPQAVTPAPLFHGGNRSSDSRPWPPWPPAAAVSCGGGGGASRQKPYHVTQSPFLSISFHCLPS